MNTFMKKKEDQQIKWYLIDAEDKILGRVATKIASILRGKDDPQFTPHLDGGAGVIVINVEKIKISGNKAQAKTYFWHTGHPGGDKYKTYEELMADEKKQDVPLMRAVKGMLPKNRTRKTSLTRLRIFSGTEHNLGAQKPIKLEI